MYISKIELKNIKCFDHTIINLETNNGFFNGCLILGDNGVGKTTILRSIAMTLSGEASASGLADEVEGGWIKKGEKEGFIRLEFRSERDKNRYVLTTFFSKESGDVDVVDRQEVEPKNFPWKDLFVCGYGASRGIVGDTQYSKHSITDAIYTLFVFDTGYLQNPELVIRRIKDADQNNSRALLNKILNWVSTILMLNDGDIKLDSSGLFVSGPWGDPMPVGTLADGHQAIITLVADILGWALLFDKNSFEKELSGIVIIDEIEQHLHPKWQRKIISLLKKVFPKVQFIITTHSPLIAGNTGQFLEKIPASKLFFLNQTNNGVQGSEIEEKLGELDFDQILSSEAFGYITSVNQEVENILREASILAGKDKKTGEDEDKLKKIKDILKDNMFPKGKSLIERVVERDYYVEIEKRVEELRDILHKDNT